MARRQHAYRSGPPVHRADVRVVAAPALIDERAALRRPHRSSIVRSPVRAETAPRCADDNAVVVVAELDVGGERLPIRRPRGPLTLVLQAVRSLSTRLHRVEAAVVDEGDVLAVRVPARLAV